MEIRDHVAIVTGGASGLGEACVRGFVKEGAKVAILDFDEDRGQKIVSELGPSTIFCKIDVIDENHVAAAIHQTMVSFGAIHFAVNCAGVVNPAKVLNRGCPMSMSGFFKVVNINLMGTMNIIRLAAEKMVLNVPNGDGEKGVVINTASVAAYEGQIGQAAYAASKAGVVGLTLPIAREFSEYGIRVMTIAPGLFETPMLSGLPENAKTSLVKMIPFPKRLGRPSEFARLAMHVIGNPQLNGETIRLDAAIRMAAR
ncbi:MAG: SDR family NAD(P)-dependent oxidoreductase [Proteobacteria bacterium]|nr:SDR family NAD(P)-dependent oxidoreductase [Pseudomonadota bacterium]MBU1582842.1 SDR family NAD(P)-dependent oxidoreductase [Pseudomonadota bacterium]MBU2451841.1 SDR family NAD(P)-dependent oxidoreductase [Pseudomonadota bacterium]MBU2629537.1 SDR family NAD(P)-dependent oxidoreductase [Pseudomonadota bacterium]